jgi:integrase
MARTVRDANLESRAARSRLPARRKPYWRKIDQGAHLGYYKGSRAASWIARYFLGNHRYAETTLGKADDVSDADDVDVFDFRQAQAKARAWFSDQARRAAGLSAAEGPYTVRQAIDDYFEWLRSEGKRSLASSRLAANAHILPALGHLEVGRLTVQRVRDWHRDLAKAPARLRSARGAPVRHRADAVDADAQRRRQASANRVLTILKAALNHAWREEKVASDAAWRRVKPFRNVETPVVRYLTEAECVRLVNACAPDFRRLVQGALLTGLRYGELAVLTARDFNPDAGTVTVRLGKGGKARHVVLTEEGQQLFSSAVASRLTKDPIFTRASGKVWGRAHQFRPMVDACHAAQIKPAVGFHVLRHTHASQLALRGVPMRVIADQLGHADTRMTERHYAHLSPSYVAETIRASFPKLGIVEHSSVSLLTRRRG